MSFATEQKNEIISAPQKNACCRRATLLGVLASRATAEGDNIYIRINGDDIISYVSSLITEIYGKEPSFSPSKNGGRVRVITFNSKSASKYIANLSNSTMIQQKCALCKAAFVRGAFLACGKVSDPKKQIFAELSPLDERVMIFGDFLSELGLSFSLIRRGNTVSLYAKRSETVEDFFAMTGMNSTFFTFMNEKINKESRNHANRVSNCETNNIAKTVDAAAKQIALISELDKRGLLNALPEELVATARLRLLYTDMSLSQLALVSNPPISKSGLSHRLKKITKIAEQLIKVS